MAARNRGGEPPMESNQETGVYFWASGSGESLVQLSNRPHPRLPLYCARHDWWTDKPCMASHEPEQLSLR
jgi:hypothetical protein